MFGERYGIVEWTEDDVWIDSFKLIGDIDYD